MEDGRILRIIYTFFLGLLLAAFVGFGINTFYEPPAAPKYPVELNTYGKELTAEQVAKQKAFDLQNEHYQEELRPYNRNVSIVALGTAVILFIASVVFHGRIKFISDGVMLGGLFTLLYSVVRGFASEDSKYVFAVVTIGLLIVLCLGYYRFVRGHGPHLQPAS